MKSKLTKLLLFLVATSCVIVYAATEVRWDEAGKYYGQTVTVTGKIVATHNSGKACFLNFHQNYRKYFSAVIFASDFQKFPTSPEDYYLNKEVRITGLVKEYQGKPEIILKNPDQIEIVGAKKTTGWLFSVIIILVGSGLVVAYIKIKMVKSKTKNPV